MKNEMKSCPACGTEIAASAKSCPHCGAKCKKPLYKKWWFYAIIAIILIGIGSAGGSDAPASSGNAGGSNISAPAGSTSSAPAAEPEQKPISYAQYNVTELFDALDSNALKAEKTFKDQHVELEGYVSNIDSSGDYISIGAAPNDYDYFLDSVQCYIKTDEQLEKVLELSVGDPIVIRGKIKRVGEVLGYSLDIDSID